MDRIGEVEVIIALKINKTWIAGGVVDVHTGCWVYVLIGHNFNGWGSPRNAVGRACVADKIPGTWCKTRVSLRTKENMGFPAIVNNGGCVSIAETIVLSVDDQRDGGGLGENRGRKKKDQTDKQKKDCL